MKKMPTIYLRDPETNLRYVKKEPNPDCDWVFAGEGRATRKWDGTCVMLDDNNDWWTRREVKPGKPEPDGWVEVDHDPITGKRVGWEPAEQSGFFKFLAEAIENHSPTSPGTYELIGPKINGNPEEYDEHWLIRHCSVVPIRGVPTTFEALAFWLADFKGEGVVWQHPDGRMAKIKRQDFPMEADQ
jgi:hypothetical protein